MLVYMLFFCTIAVFGQEMKLVITPSQNPVQKPAGQQISLLCTVEGQLNRAKPGLMWSKHGGLQRNSNVRVEKLDAFTISLTVMNASSEDTGVYTCQAQMDEQLLQKTVDVVVFAINKTGTSKDMILLQNNRILPEDYSFVDKSTTTGAVMATAAVNISCEVTPNTEQMKTVWTKIGHASWAPGVGHHLYKNGAILEITNYDPITDAGDYSCKVYHSVTGTTIYKKITVGSEMENRRMFCNNMCTQVCTNLYANKP